MSKFYRTRLKVLTNAIKSVIRPAPDRPLSSTVLTEMLRQAGLPHWSGELMIQWRYSCSSLSLQPGMSPEQRFSMISGVTVTSIGRKVTTSSDWLNKMINFMFAGWWSQLSCSKNGCISFCQISHQQKTSSRSNHGGQLLQVGLIATVAYIYVMNPFHQSFEMFELWLSNIDVWHCWTVDGKTYWTSSGQWEDNNYLLLVQRK